MLADNDFNHGDGRAVYGGQELILEKGFDCTAYPSVGAKEASGDIGSYCFRIF